MKKFITLFVAVLLAGSMTMKAEKEIYAVFDEPSSTLTLRYDDQREANGGMTDWQTDDLKAKTTLVVLDENMKEARPGSLWCWFAQFGKLKEIQHLDYLNTSEAISMASTFYGCGALETLDVSHFNTENVVSMHTMFLGCSSLKSLDVSHFNTEKVKKMVSMFDGCEKIQTLDLSNFNTPLLEGDLFAMFRDCKELISLTLGRKFDVSRVTEMRNMFAGCEKLTSLDLTYFNPASAEALENMFSGCTNLTTIYCNGDWSEHEGYTNTNRIFENCNALVGGRGTAYNTTFMSVEYARPDDPENSKPGYFTRKSETAIDEISNDKMRKCENAKILHNGQLFILRDGVFYNAQGARVE